MNSANGEIRLHETWQRLETICRGLWDANSPTALDMQAVVEEFKGEAHRAEQMISTLRKNQDELRETLAKDLQQASADEIRPLLVELKTLREHAAVLEAAVAEKEKRNQELLKEIAGKEATDLEFHEKFLASSAEQDEARAKKMESFYEDLQKKEAAIEAEWETRRAELETGYKQRNEALKRKHEESLAELQARAAALEQHYSKRERELETAQERFRAEREAWEAGRLSESQAVSKRKEELALQAENLAGDYKKKQAELQRIKEAMQSELAEVVRQYQARMRESRA
ncbi:MAG: hypothetical protein HY922_01845 [Elusimicrobia bacterium]|nr:hypothetical protein [Elusimicrobiota bacterium]